MLDTYFLKVNEMIMAAGTIAYIGAFIWGIISVIFSPCHLSSIPLIIAYIGGFTEDKKIKNAFYYSLLFCVGLFISISAIGVITSMLGRMLGDIGNIGNYIVGGILIIVAIYLFGLFQINIPGLQKLQTTRKGAFGAFLLGLSFGIISGPCTFGFIMPMLTIVAVQDTFIKGVILIIIFALGHCVPILIGGCATSFVQKISGSDKLQKSGILFKKIFAVIFFIVGLYLIFK